MNTFQRFGRAAVTVAASLSLATMGVPAGAFADQVSDKQAEADAVRQELESYQTTLDEASDAYYDALGAHDDAQKKMKGAQKDIKEAQEELTGLQGHLSTRARSMYRSGSTTFIDVLLGADSFEDFVTMWDTLTELNAEDEGYVSKTKAVKQKAEDAEKTYSEQEKLAADELQKADDAKAQAEQVAADYQARIDSLDAEVAQLIEEREKAEAEAARRAAAEQAAAEKRKAAEEKQEAASDETPKSSSDSDDSTQDKKATGDSPKSSSESSESTDSSEDSDNEATESEERESSSSSGRSDGSYSTVVAAAKSRLGCPYVWGADGPSTFDCSGLVMWCYAKIGVSLPHSSSSQHYCGTIKSVSQAQPGDILWRSGHVAIYVGGGSAIHAPHSGANVCYTNASGFSCAVHI